MTLRIACSLLLLTYVSATVYGQQLHGTYGYMTHDLVAQSFVYSFDSLSHTFTYTTSQRGDRQGSGIAFNYGRGVYEVNNDSLVLHYKLDKRYEPCLKVDKDFKTYKSQSKEIKFRVEAARYTPINQDDTTGFSIQMYDKKGKLVYRNVFAYNQTKNFSLYNAPLPLKVMIVTADNKQETFGIDRHYSDIGIKLKYFDCALVDLLADRASFNYLPEATLRYKFNFDGQSLLLGGSHFVPMNEGDKPSIKK